MSWGSLSQFSPNLQQPMPTMATLSRMASCFMAGGKLRRARGNCKERSGHCGPRHRTRLTRRTGLSLYCGMPGTGQSDGKVVRLTAERLQRLERRMGAVETAIKGTNARLDDTNARLDQTNARLDQAVDVLTGLVRVVKAQND